MKRSMKRNFTFSDSLLSAMDSGKALHVAAAHPARLGVMLNAGEGGNGDGKTGSGDNGGDAGKGNDKSDDNKADGKGDDKPSYDELELQYLRTQKALRKANREAEQRRLELEEAKAGKKKGDEKKADDGEAEKLKKQLADTEEKSRKRIIKAAVMLEASKLGFHDPADAFALADLSDIEFDEEKDDVSGVEDALKELAKKKPHLIKTAESNSEKPSQKKPDINAGAKGNGKSGELAIDEDAIRRKYSIR